MARITNITSAWSSAVTLSSAEFWQVVGGPIYIATGATSEPASLDDGLLLTNGDIIDLANGEVVRYRSTDTGASLTRRAHA